MLFWLLPSAFGQAFPVGSIELPDASHSGSRLTAGPIASIFDDDAGFARWMGGEVEGRVSAGPFDVSADLLASQFAALSGDELSQDLVLGGAAFTSWRVLDTETLRIAPFGSHQYGTFTNGEFAYSKTIGAVVSGGRPERVAIHLAVPLLEIDLPTEDPFALGYFGSQLGLSTVQGRHEISGLLGILVWTSRYRYLGDPFTFDVSWSTAGVWNTVAVHAGARF